MSSSAASPTPAPARWALAIHGGAGAISREFDPERLEYLAALRASLDAGASILRSGGSALDAVQAAVESMEDCPLYNAGVGSVFTAAGTHELDAAVMRGSDMQAGAVAGVRTVKNPVRLARTVLEASPHVLLISSGAEEFAALHALEQVDNSYFTTPARLKVHGELVRQAQAMEQQHLETLAAASTNGPTASPHPAFMMKPVLDHSSEQAHPTAAEPAASTSNSADSAAQLSADHAREKKYGTVGAVALDMSGDLATAISTGGMSMKAYGRVGDTPIIGAGFYATKRVAVSCTGNGEAFMRCAVAKDVSALMDYAGLTVTQAADRAMATGEQLLGLEEFEGGLIAIDAQGTIAMPYNSKGMYRGSIGSDQPEYVGVWRELTTVEPSDNSKQ